MSSEIKFENLFTSNSPASLIKRSSELKLGLCDKKYSRWSDDDPIPSSLISWFNNSILTDSSHAVVKACKSLKLYDFLRTSIWFLKSEIESSSPFTLPIGSWDWNPLPSNTPAITKANNAIPITAIRTNEFFLRLPSTAIFQNWVTKIQILLKESTTKFY